jgi:myo-inositol catabolism protein IolC
MQLGITGLGRDEGDQKVREWLTIASGVEGFIGLAVGRADFRDPLVNFRAPKITGETAVTETGRRYQEFAGIFQQARPE